MSEIEKMHENAGVEYNKIGYFTDGIYPKYVPASPLQK